MNVLIVGAQLGNKGAESMLYVTVDEVKKRIPNANVYFATTETYDEEKYCFNKVHYSNRGKTIALGGFNAVWTFGYEWLKDAAKKILNRNSDFGHFFDVKSMIAKVDLMIDVSGYNLGDKWGYYVQEAYLDNIRLAQKYSIPVIVMPQSFGPFNECSKKAQAVRQDIGKLMKYPLAVFAREKEGYDIMTNDFMLSNIQLSTDLVLQNTGIDWTHIYKGSIIADIPAIKTNKNVGIIPNRQCFAHGNSDAILELYAALIEKIVRQKKNVYIFRHSVDDLTACRRIYDKVSNLKNVHLVEKEFSCVEYEKFICNFDYLVCSRFHGIVHAYKNGIPCIALGWAIKYQELCRTVGQEEFAFDIVKGSNNFDRILDAADLLCKERERCSKTILEHLFKVQNENCYTILDDLIK